MVVEAFGNDARNGGDLGVVGILDLLDRPALALGEDGRLLALNAALARFCRDRLARDFARVDDLLDPDDAGHLAALARRPGEVPQSRVGVLLRDGSPGRMRVQRIETPRGGVLVAVLESPPPGGVADDVGSLRHDLAGPLTSIIGTAELLLGRGHEMPREMREALGRIIEDCGRITEILAASRNGRVSREDG